MWRKRRVIDGRSGFGRGETSDVTTLLTILVFGVYTGSLLAIGSVGFTLQFGVTNVLNLAYGAILTSAMFVEYWISGGNSNVWLALLIGALGGGVVSLVFGRVIVTPYGRGGTTLFGMAMVTIGVGLVLQFTLEAIQGPLVYSYSLASTGEYHIGSVIVSGRQLVAIGSAVGLMLAIHVLLRYSRLGLAMRATAEDPSLARACGVSTTRVRTIAWLLSGSLCGVAGVFLGISTGSFNATTGAGFFITLIAAAIIGGVGKPYGAMIGALIVGLTSEAAAALISPSYKNIVAWGVLILVLLFRPRGIFSEFAAERELAA
jgi:branched-chain amino acid transport system permease protein/neutral amino acid transport system permease protein